MLRNVVNNTPATFTFPRLSPSTIFWLGQLVVSPQYLSLQFYFILYDIWKYRHKSIVKMSVNESLVLRLWLTLVLISRSEFDCFQIELSKNYGAAEWREDLRQVMMKAGLKNKPMVFLFSDTQVSLCALLFLTLFMHKNDGCFLEVFS